MVGIVIVSHSAKLAEGVAELAHEMAGPDMRIATAGGLDLPDATIGTDAAKVAQAIEQVYSDDGVIVLMDVGSAVLSAEMALDMLSPEQRERVRLCDAPLVEGAIAAAAQARSGASLDQVAAEARNALNPKQSQLGPTMDGGRQRTNGASSSDVHRPSSTLRVVVPNRLGFHARPAARIVQAVLPFRAELSAANLTRSSGPVSARSLNALLTLGVQQRHEIEFTASGDDAEAALAAIRALAEANFGDDDRVAPTRVDTVVEAPQVEAEPGVLRGIAASPGIAIGAAKIVHSVAPSGLGGGAGTPHEEWTKLDTALERAKSRIRSTRELTAERAGKAAAGIFDVHLLLIADEAEDGLRAMTRRSIFDDRLPAALAWDVAVKHLAARYRVLDSEYVRARAADVEDVGRQVLAQLVGSLSNHWSDIVSSSDVILCAEDFSPTDIVQMNTRVVKGLCGARGAATGHTVILARSLDVPAVFGLGQAILDVPEGAQLIVDATTGRVHVAPDEATVRNYAARIDREAQRLADARAMSHQPASTRDGKWIEITANVGSLADVRAAIEAGADGVGLFRTEFLFLGRDVAPNEDEQYEAYRAAAEAMQGRPVIIRTLDIGGDKPLPYLEQEREANPFLGLRGIRFCLAHPELFKMQLRAIARTAAEFPIRVMFPMIATLAEWRAARSIWVNEWQRINEWERINGLHDDSRTGKRIEVGIMIEVPAAAMLAEQFAREVDFFSVGTNDLAQFVFAAERDNPHVASLTDGLHPALLKLISHVCEAAHAQGKRVGVCGELANDPFAVRLLIGLGVDELSMNAPAIPQVKQIARSLNVDEMKALALKALDAQSADEVRGLMEESR